MAISGIIYILDTVWWYRWVCVPVDTCFRRSLGFGSNPKEERPATVGEPLEVPLPHPLTYLDEPASLAFPASGLAGATGLASGLD